MNTKEIGNITEAAFIAELLKHGVSVSIPFGNSEPYDIVIKTKYGFKSVQIKHALYKNGCIVAYPKKFIGYSKRNSISYDGLCDYIGVWCEEINGFYLLTVKECKKRTMLVLRIEPPKNNSSISTVIWAQDFCLENRLKELL